MKSNIFRACGSLCLVAGVSACGGTNNTEMVTPPIPFLTEPALDTTQAVTSQLTGNFVSSVSGSSTTTRAGFQTYVDGTPTEFTGTLNRATNTLTITSGGETVVTRKVDPNRLGILSGGAADFENVYGDPVLIQVLDSIGQLLTPPEDLSKFNYTYVQFTDLVPNSDYSAAIIETVNVANGTSTGRVGFGGIPTRADALSGNLTYTFTGDANVQTTDFAGTATSNVSYNSTPTVSVDLANDTATLTAVLRPLNGAAPLVDRYQVTNMAIDGARLTGGTATATLQGADVDISSDGFRNETILLGIDASGQGPDEIFIQQGALGDAGALNIVGALD